MIALKATVLVTFLGLVYGCSHPLEIVGEGDVLSATGTRNCYYEDYLAGAESCSKNLVVQEYSETYYAVPREGWEFEKWLNCWPNTSGDECAFEIPADAVKIGWGQTMPSLVAVFVEAAAPTPEPVAMYSYELDAAGGLLNPLPLEGAQIQRRSVYFSFSGEYSKVNFWCCKVPDGDEPHLPEVADETAPFVLRVDTGALSDDDGLQRELYADIFNSNGDYTGHYAYWTLEPKPTDVIRLEGGGVYNIDYTVDVAIGMWSLPPATLNILEGANVTHIDGAEGTINISGGKVAMLSLFNAAEFHVSGGEVGDLTPQQPFYGSGLISGGQVQAVNWSSGDLLISGGTIDWLGLANGGEISVEISGGVLRYGIYSSMTGGELEISGGGIHANLHYTDYGNPPVYVFYGSNLALTEPVLIETGEYESMISGTLRDGTPIATRVLCTDARSSSVLPLCNGVRMVNEL